MFDYSKLLGKIVEVFGTQGNFAQAIGLSENTLSRKLNNKVDWKVSEINKAVEELGIERVEIPLYFFTPKV